MEHLRITVEGKTYDVVVEKLGGDETASQAQPARAAAPRPAAAAPAASPAPAAATPPPPVGEGTVPSPLAGIVQAIEVSVGSTVKEGDLVITLEAMKMYTPINAPTGGTITAIHVKVGDSVDEGQALYTLG